MRGNPTKKERENKSNNNNINITIGFHETASL
jgi:hypothetical protein